ncbi:MAG: Potassium channel [Thelocarpon impressellum]|nr:MAG: Potassium channel [Thelocarpon impressellum]
MHRYVPPVRPQQTYSQGFWYAIIAAVLYLINAMILMVNMLGYFLGHYPQHFTLSDHQRTLILQTMMFFLWLAGGAGVFARVCSWSYADALYFCDVTVLTIGFGDFAAPNDAGKGLVFPFSVGGIVMLGLVVSSINKFTTEISHDKVIKKHVEKERRRTVSRSVTKPIEAPPERPGIAKERGKISAPIPRPRQAVSFGRTTTEGQQPHRRLHSASNRRLKRRMKHLRQMTPKRPREIVLREEKDRFDAMRKIQHNTNRFKRWYNLSMSVTAFGLLWCVGAAVFWKAERREQGLTYFQALYFCYVSLLTIGYGDLSPRSNAGKPFFVVWSLVAVPTMTILIGDLSDTVIASFKRGTVTLADLTVLPQAGRWKSFLLKIGIWSWVQRKVESRAEKKRIAGGFLVAEDEEAPPTIEELAQAEPTDQDLAKKLALAIRRVADHLNAEPAKRYSYEEWVEFTRLIRFSTESDMAVEADEEEEGLIEWDWIGENSPMLAEQSEAEWILDRLCESLSRYMTRHSRHHKHRRRMRQPADGPLMEKVEEEGPEEADEAEEDEGEKYGGASRKERSTENRS